MSKKTNLKPIAAALGATFAVSLMASPIVNAAQNPFELTELSSGYMQLAEGNCGEGKCGEGADGEGKCGEGADGEGKCGEGADGEGADAADGGDA